MNTPSSLHPLQEAYHKKAPFTLRNSFGEALFWVQQAVELLRMFPEHSSFWDISAVFQEKTGLQISTGGNYFWIPETGPLVVAANHPYTLLDAISMGNILEKRRKSRIQVLSDSPAGLIPEWDHLNIALAKSLQEMIEMQRKVDELLSSWGTLLMFPAGQTSFRHITTGKTQETRWKPWVIKFAQRVKAPILPIHIEAQTSELYNFLKNFFSRELIRNLNLREASRKNVSVHVTIWNLIEDTKTLTTQALQEKIYEIGREVFEISRQV